ncbi:hypothetical protein JG687_00017484, partial [Phytophthora cactorum]
LEKRKRPEACQASRVTIGEPVVVQLSESFSDGETSASCRVNIAIEDSCIHSHVLRSTMKVVQPATNVRLESIADTGAPDLVTITVEGICPYDEPPPLCSMIISSEDSATGPEAQDTTDEAIVPVPRVHLEFSGDTGVSAPVTATPGGVCPDHVNGDEPGIEHSFRVWRRRWDDRDSDGHFERNMCRALPTLWICKNHFRRWPRKPNTFRQFVRTLLCYMRSYHATTEGSSCRLTDR